MKRILQIIQKSQWKFARTMSAIPHWYIIRGKTCNDSDFIYLAKYIREHGYKEKFFSKSFTYLNINGFKYWTYGDALNTPEGKPYTIVLNRARIQYKTDYDKIADQYNTYFSSNEYKQEDKDLISFIQPRGSILDVGCGTGLLLEHISPERYVGIDISKGMLKRLKENHPEYASKVINSTVNDFYAVKKFDTIIGLYGVGSYITKAEVEKLKKMLSPTGKMYMMYFADDYFPVTHDISGIKTKYSNCPYPDTVRHNNHIIYIYDRSNS